MGMFFADPSSEHDPYEAERHLALGTKESPEYFARLEYEWYTEDESHTAALYAARAVFPYLLIGNLRDANRSLQIFTSRLTESNKSLSVQDTSSATADLRIYPSLPLLNFFGLLLQSVQRGSAELFRLLKSHYAIHIRDAGTWDDVSIPKNGCGSGCSCREMNALLTLRYHKGIRPDRRNVFRDTDKKAD
jgi:hypothetical protein